MHHFLFIFPLAKVKKKVFKRYSSSDDKIRPGKCILFSRRNKKMHFFTLSIHENFGWVHTERYTADKSGFDEEASFYLRVFFARSSKMGKRVEKKYICAGKETYFIYLLSHILLSFEYRPPFPKGKSIIRSLHLRTMFFKKVSVNNPQQCSLKEERSQCGFLCLADPHHHGLFPDKSCVHVTWENQMMMWKCGTARINFFVESWLLKYFSSRISTTDTKKYYARKGKNDALWSKNKYAFWAPVIKELFR